MGGCVLAVVGWALSQVPLYLVLSCALTIAFGASHPVVAPPVESVWVAHGAGAVQVQLSWMLAGAVLLPLLLLADVTDRALRSTAMAALLVVSTYVVRWLHPRKKKDAASEDGPGAEGNTCDGAGTSRGAGLYSVWHPSNWVELVKCWDMLPAPAVRNVADGTSGDRLVSNKASN